MTRDVVVPARLGARAHREPCPRCPDVGMDWIPAIGAVDAKEPFQRFSTFDGQNRPVTISSLRDLRRLERESEQQARNGEGQPLVFRRWSQDTSNADQHTLQGRYTGPAETPDPAWLAKQRIGRHGGEDAVLGPGVTEATASALPK